jgi:WD40 repeat protein
VWAAIVLVIGFEVAGLVVWLWTKYPKSDDGSKKYALAFLRGHSEVIETLAFSHDGRLLASGAGDGKIIIWDMRDMAPVAELTMHVRAISALCFSHDDKWMASGDWGSGVFLWDTSNWKGSRIFRGKTWAPVSIAFSPDDASLAFGPSESYGSVQLWDVKNKCVETEVTISGSAVRALGFLNRGKDLVVVDQPGDVVLYHVETREREVKYNVARGMNNPSFWFLNCDSEGTSFATLPDEREPISIWSIDNHVPIATFRTEDRMPQSGMAITANRKWLITTGGMNGMKPNDVHVWNTRSETVLTSFHPVGHSYSIACSPDGRLLATGRTDEIVCVWDLAKIISEGSDEN